MNYNKHVLIVSLFFLTVLLGFSVLINNYPNQLASFSKISILSDIIKSAENIKDTKQDVVKKEAVQEIESAYLIPHRIGICNQSDKVSGLVNLMNCINEIKKTNNGKVRIAWFGDSMIEGDLITQTIRKILQDSLLGHHAVGFVAPKTVSSDNRITARSSLTGDFTTYHFHKTNPNFNLFYSGYVYSIRNGVCKITDNTVDSNDLKQPLFKYFVCGKGAPCDITVNGQPLSINPNNAINFILIDSSKNNSVTCAIQNEQLPVYGFSFEMKNGVIVDNFSFRGITGIEYNKIDTSVLNALSALNTYDLLVFQFGVNLMFRANDKQYTYYQRAMDLVLKKFKNYMPNKDILIISTFDRAFKYENGWATAIGIDTLVATQQQLACSNQLSFYNLFQTMGGHGTIVRWADSSIALANHDYIHPNRQGAVILGNTIANDLLKTINIK
jgi:lysophospholipase L1-like esterase